MSISRWKQIRIGLLAITFGGVVFVLGKSILYPSIGIGSRPVTPFVFPATIPLPEWQMLESAPLEFTEGSRVLAGREYRYRQNRLSLEIKMLYANPNKGDVEGLMEKLAASEQKPGKLAIRQQEGIGFYGVLAHQGRAYLSACINPRGGSTVTTDQFRHNRNTYDVQFTRILPWLLGKEELRDWRCLWTQMSIPIQNTSAEDAYPALETAWISWYQWWQPHFPTP